MDKLGKIIKSSYKWSVAVITFAVSVYLLILNVISTSYTTADSFELNYYCSDMFVITLASIILIFVAGKLLINKTTLLKKIDSLDYKKTRKIILLAICLMGSFWSLSLNLSARVDQLYIQQAVYSSAWGNFESFKSSGYMDLYPNQAGFFIISCLISKVFGTYNYLAFGIINSICLALFYKELSDIGHVFKMKDREKLALLLSGVLFTPLIMYSAFVYGTIIGIYFAALSMRLMIQYMNQKTGAYKAVLSLVFMVISISAKSNYLIFMVALAIYVIVKALSGSPKDRVKSLWAIGLIVAYFMATSVPILILQKVSGEPYNQGASSWSWIAMGMQENSQNYAGGFNGFNEDTYRYTNYMSEPQSEIAKEEIKISLNQFASNPTYALNFYTRKTIHQWADPAYKGYYLVQALDRGRNMAPLSYALMTPQAQNVFIKFLDVFQVLIYLGTASFIWTKRKDSNFAQWMLFPMTFIGGFLFHIIWEAKSEYSISYFVMLLPVGILGFIELMKAICATDGKKLKASLSKLNNQTLTWTSSFTLVLCALILVFAEILGLGTLRNQFREDNRIYGEYVKSGYKNTWGALDSGIYQLKSDDSDYVLGSGKVRVVTVNGISRIQNTEDETYLTVRYMGKKNTNIYFESYMPGNTQEFRILDGGDNKVYILYGEYHVLVLKDGEITLEPQYGSKHISYREPVSNELWTISEG